MTKGEAPPALQLAVKTPAAEEIAQHLVVLIRDGMIPAGTKLPTEHHLSRQFGVSRTVVREAISRLKADGLVESRQGSGVSVIPASLRKSFKLQEAVLGHQQVIELLGLKTKSAVKPEHIADLRGYMQSLKDKEVLPEDLFKPEIDEVKAKKVADKFKNYGNDQVNEETGEISEK